MPITFNETLSNIVLEPSSDFELGEPVECALQLPEPPWPEGAHEMIFAYRVFVNNPFGNEQELTFPLNVLEVPLSTNPVSAFNFSGAFYFGLKFDSNIEYNDGPHNSSFRRNFVGVFSAYDDSYPQTFRFTICNVNHGPLTANYGCLFAPLQRDQADTLYGIIFNTGGIKRPIFYPGDDHQNSFQLSCEPIVPPYHLNRPGPFSFTHALSNDNIGTWLFPVSNIHQLTSYGPSYPWTVYWRFQMRGNNQVQITFYVSRDPIIRGENSNLFTPLTSSSSINDFIYTRKIGEKIITTTHLHNWRPTESTINFPKYFVMRWSPPWPYNQSLSSYFSTQSLIFHIDRLAVLYRRLNFV